MSKDDTMVRFSFWEQGRNRSDHAARAFLKVIAYNPEMVRKALASDL